MNIAAIASPVPAIASDGIGAFDIGTTVAEARALVARSTERRVWLIVSNGLGARMPYATLPIDKASFLKAIGTWRDGDALTTRLYTSGAIAGALWVGTFS